jgi:hypothetical protein
MGIALLFVERNTERGLAYTYRIGDLNGHTAPSPACQFLNLLLAFYKFKLFYKNSTIHIIPQIHYPAFG